MLFRSANEKAFDTKYTALWCDVVEGFQFEFSGKSPIKSGSYCMIKTKAYVNVIGLIWPKSGTKKILDGSLNISNLMKYSVYFWDYIKVELFNLDGFDIDLFNSS